jgi:two-component sensor histidine kinase
LREKEILLKEIHHRVKNNLQVISSLLSLQSEKLQDQQAGQLFRDSQNRIRSMALIHEKLYQSHDLARIDIRGYIQSLSHFLMRSFAAEARSVDFQTQVDEIFLGIDQAVPCGLIINELVSNALKHAFPNHREGVVFIRLHKDGEGQIHLEVGDNGIGFPEGVDFQNTTSLGLQLVNSLVGQLDGTITLNCTAGAIFLITFREPGTEVEGSAPATALAPVTAPAPREDKIDAVVDCQASPAAAPETELTEYADHKFAIA